MLEHGFRKYEIIKLLNDIKKTIKRVEENVPTQIDNAINQLLDGAPEALDTLKELADALGNNPDIITELNNKIDSIDIKKDWNQNDENADDYIENRTHYKEDSEYIFYSDEQLNNRLTLDEAVERVKVSNNTTNYIYFKYKRIKLVDNTVASSEVGIFYISTSNDRNNKLVFAYKSGNYYSYPNQEKYSNGYKSFDILDREDITKETLINWIKNNIDGYDISGNHGAIVATLEKTEEIYHKLDSNYLPDNINDSITLKESSIPSGGFEPNRFYELGEITQDTTFTLKTPTNNNILNKYIIQFSIGSTVPNIIWPSNIKWENGSAPTINANKEYLLKIINNLAQIKEF